MSKAKSSFLVNMCRYRFRNCSRKGGFMREKKRKKKVDGKPFFVRE